MARLAFLALAVSLSCSVYAETVDIKDVNTQGDEATSTTIEIKKGKLDQVKSSNQWEVTDGSAEVEGESGPTQKDARANWRKSCADWKKELREDNKENKVISLNCGTMSCTGEAGNKTCTSKATFKIKTRVN